MDTETKIVKHQGPREFSTAQEDLIKRTIAKGASNDELALFLNQCRRTGLDPFTRQIYFTKRRTKNRQTGQWEEIGTTQTGIDGFRVIAERTEEYDGTESSWCGADGIWKDVWLEDGPPAAARVVAYRKGCSRPFTGIAKWSEYVQTTSEGEPIGLWRKMKANQLAKCLPGKVLIQTDRGSIPIGRIVNQRLPVKVRSIDLSSGQECWQPVTNFWRNGSTREWLRLWTLNGIRGSRCLRMTPEHPVWTPHGWRQSGRLRIGDSIAVASPTLSPEQEQVILGSLLGDASMSRQRPRSLPHYSESHSVRQGDYLSWKITALSNIVSGSWSGFFSDGVGGEHPTTRMWSKAIPALLPLWAQTAEQMLSQIQPLGLAVWIMDDGNLKRTGNVGTNPSLRLYCCGFDAAFADTATTWFAEKYGVTASVIRREKNPYLSIGVDGTRRLLSALEPFIRYDESTNTKEWKGAPIRQGLANGFAFAPVTRLESVRQSLPSGRYDIEVADTHTFLYGNVVVSNCAEALALRKAYPNDLSGLYTAEEMGQADSDPEAQTAVIEATPVSPLERLSEDQQARVQKMFTVLKSSAGLQTQKLNEFLGGNQNVETGFEALMQWGIVQHKALKEPVERKGDDNGKGVAKAADQKSSAKTVSDHAGQPVAGDVGDRKGSLAPSASTGLATPSMTAADVPFGDQGPGLGF